MTQPSSPADPATTPPPPPHAVGFASRDSGLDVLPGFVSPPAGYGEVAFFWWLGDPLTRERLQWQLDQVSDKHLSGLQINYAHSDTGGASYGLTYPSDPPLFSEPWWDLVGWFMDAAKRRGMAVSLSDYTIGPPGQGWYADELIAEHPETRGSVLQHAHASAAGNTRLEWSPPAGTLRAVAYRRDGKRLDPASAIDLTAQMDAGTLRWDVPAGAWEVHAVVAVVKPLSIDPMHPLTGSEVVRRFFQQFEDRFPGEGGRGLNFFFSDELQFNVSGRLWTADFADEFRRRKGYDLLPELPALFVDLGPRTTKLRMDYWDVQVSLQEERYFKPLFDWHQQRGMIYGCDHGGRGKNVGEFGDYFRTQRWNQGPGADQPGLGKDVIKAKVAASIAHLYQRPRVWIEGYYGSGWGTTSAQVTDATFANFAMGFNLLTLHGMYYSTHGGFWEWAPPCNHHHMPYWAHAEPLLACTERLSYLMSQGVHRCDVAIVYPVESVHAGRDARAATILAFDLAERLYRGGIDLDFIDHQSLERADCDGSELCVSGERYRVLVIPDMAAVRHSTIEKALAFHRSGGIVLALGALPEASERIGAADPELDAMVREIFGASASEAGPAGPISLHHSGRDGAGVRVAGAEEAAAFIVSAVPRDFDWTPRAGAETPYIQHRVIGDRHVYYVYGLSKGTECTFRATGAVERWDPWTGRTEPLAVIGQTATHTRLALPVEKTEVNLLVFRAGTPAIAATTTPRRETVVPVEGEWEFEVVPSLDNRFGDFAWPATREPIGPQVRQIRYRLDAEGTADFSAAGVDDSAWPKVTSSFGPKFWRLGPLPDDADFAALDAQLAALTRVDPAEPVRAGGREFRWSPYAFSWRWGLEGDPGPQGYHGLKNRVTDDFLALGRRDEVKHSSVYRREEAGRRYYVWTALAADGSMNVEAAVGGVAPAAAWLNHQPVSLEANLPVRPGANPLLLRYDDAGRSHVVVGAKGLRGLEPLPEGSLSMRWRDASGVVPFDPIPELQNPAGWYRFTSPPGLVGMTLTVIGEPTVWIDGVAVPLGPAESLDVGGATRYRVTVPTPVSGTVSVAIRVALKPGSSGGAALPEPIELRCGPGTFAAGDWSRNDGLLSYSGSAWYRRTIALDAVDLRGAIELDLGEVISSAEVRLNGQTLGVRVAPPWRFDLTPAARAGSNRLEVLVYSTLGNHYTTIPSKYRGSPAAGLIGPVTLRRIAANP